MKKILLLPIICFGLTVPAFAQMFSVGDEGPNRSNPFAPYIRAGVKAIDFDFTGDPSAVNAENDLSLSGLAGHLSFETGGFNLNLSLANDLTGLDDQSYFNLGLEFTTPFYFIAREGFAAGVPLRLSTKLTSIRREGASTEFSQTNLSAGAGAILQFYKRDRFGITTEFIPNIGFSTASGGLVGGNVFSLAGKARVNFYNLVFGKNLSLGYNYNFDSYDIDGDDLDYDFNGHTITLGISL